MGSIGQLIGWVPTRKALSSWLRWGLAAYPRNQLIVHARAPGRHSSKIEIGLTDPRRGNHAAVANPTPPGKAKPVDLSPENWTVLMRKTRWVWQSVNRGESAMKQSRFSEQQMPGSFGEGPDIWLGRLWQRLASAQCKCLRKLWVCFHDFVGFLAH